MRKQKTVFYTDNLSQFKLIAENRIIRRPHVVELKRSIEKKNLLEYHPIVVNGKMEVIDGQHRLIAAQELGLGVWYLVGKELGFEDVKLLNVTTQRWSLDDYLHAYVSLGYSDYKTYEKFKKDTSFSHTTVMMLLRNAHKRVGSIEGDFKNGDFKVADLEIAKALAKKLQDLGTHYDKYHQRGFVLAALTMFAHSEYDHEEMLAKLEQIPYKMEEQPNTREYLRQFEAVYNFNQKVNRVRFF